MRLIALLLLVCSAACAHVRLNAATGTAVTSTSPGLHATGAGAVAALLIGATLASDGNDGPPAAPLARDRQVSEQDCTKPVELGANLRCK